MRKLENGRFLLSRSELAALASASIGEATRHLHLPGYDQNDDPLPYYVDRANQLLKDGLRLFTDEQLAGSLVADEQNGRLIEDEKMYAAVKAAFGGCAVEVHAIYAPEETDMPGWFSAAVDLFRPGQTYRVYFSHDGNYQIRIEHLHRWYSG